MQIFVLYDFLFATSSSTYVETLELDVFWAAIKQILYHLYGKG